MTLAKTGAVGRSKKTKAGNLQQRPERFDAALLILLGLLVLIIIIPFYNAIVISLVSSMEYTQRKFILWPHAVSLDNYLSILRYSTLLNGYRNTLTLVFLAVPLELFLTVTMGYCFSRSFIGKKTLFRLVIFTMFFGGGMVPTYLQIRTMGLLNNLWATILISGVSTYYLIIIKGSFESIPASLEEAAKIDGANDMRILFSVMLPLQLPMLATFTLFFTVSRWNEWYWPMLTMTKADGQVLSVFLRTIVKTAEEVANESAESDMFDNFSVGIKMASTVIIMLPIMVVYPFLQKYFVKGVMVGSIKM